MAYYQLICFSCLISLSVCSPIFSFSHYSVASEPDTSVRANEPFSAAHSGKIPSSQKVELSLYYESLCPYCQNFITGCLASVLDTDLMTILNLKLVPWGNAILQNNSIVCQHGEDECYMNIIHACGINLWPDVKTHFNFIKCIEKRSSTIPLKSVAEATWKSCAGQVGLPARSIKDCYDSGLGRQLVLQFGKETEQLRPPHQYVPWVTIDKQPIRNDYMNFVKYVCEAYRGKQPPKTCSSHPSDLTGTTELLQSLCYAPKAR